MDSLSVPGDQPDEVRLIGVQQIVDTGFSVLRRTEFDYRRLDGQWVRLQRETYDRGNGAAILLFDPRRRRVLLVQQFRYPAHANPLAHPSPGLRKGWMIEVPAGLIEDHAQSGRSEEAAIKAEAEEEVGVRVTEPRRILEAYSSPGSITERVVYFVAKYQASDRTGVGGGLEDEGEDIAVIEPTLDEALAMVERGEIADAKTIVLLYWAKLNLAELLA